MSLTSPPVNIRVNISAPFPALVSGTGPVTVTKQNGVWTVGFQVINFGVQVPPAGNYPTDYLLVYDTIAGVFFRMSISTLVTAFNAPGHARAQRAVTTSPVGVNSNDEILNINISSGSPTCSLPQASTRSGLAVTFKDVGAQFAAHNLTITPFAGDTIDGAASLVLTNNRQGVTLVPFSDGTNTGWAIE